MQGSSLDYELTQRTPFSFISTEHFGSQKDPVTLAKWFKPCPGSHIVTITGAKKGLSRHNLLFQGKKMFPSRRT